MKDRLITLPEQEKPQTVKDKVYDLISKKDMTSSEISAILKINSRMVRDAIEKIRHEIDIKTDKCRCGHTPIYWVEK